MNIVFVAGFSIISSDVQHAKKLFVDDIGLPLEDATHDGYWHSEKIDGAKHFGIWPLKQAAQACFGTDNWPSDRITPQASIEFEVADAASVAQAVPELEQKGYTMLHPARTEPWGQTVARMQTPEGLVIGISFAPWLHETQA